MTNRLSRRVGQPQPQLGQRGRASRGSASRSAGRPRPAPWGTRSPRAASRPRPAASPGGRGRRRCRRAAARPSPAPAAGTPKLLLGLARREMPSSSNTLLCMSGRWLRIEPPPISLPFSTRSYWLGAGGGRDRSQKPLRARRRRREQVVGGLPAALVGQPLEQREVGDPQRTASRPAIRPRRSPRCSRSGASTRTAASLGVGHQEDRVALGARRSALDDRGELVRARGTSRSASAISPPACSCSQATPLPPQPLANSTRSSKSLREKPMRAGHGQAAHDAAAVDHAAGSA